MKKLLLVFVALIFSGGMAWGQTTLSAGDIAIFGVNTDNPDDFGFVLLVDIQAGTEIRFTDSGWKSDNTFRGGEGTVKYTAPTALPAGTEITYQGNNADFVADNDATVGTNGFNLSASGDQVFAFQGASTSPTFIYAVQTNSNVWQSDATGSTNSAIPQGLTNGVNAVAVGVGSGAGDEYDNAGYDKSTMSGTAAQILAAVSDNSKWTGNNSTRYNLTSYDFTVSSGGSAPDNPTNFTAATSSTSQIDLSWTQNGSGDNVMVAWSTDGTFGTPTDGTSYSAGNTISGGGTVLYNGSAASYNHTGLTAGTHYYYKAWSVDGSTNYSNGVTSDATTYKEEPTNHVSSFTATANGSTKVDLSWAENDGTVTPDGYLIKASTGTITDPTDGTDPADDTDLTDGSGNVKVTHGTTSYNFTNCNASTTYNFKIYPYTNSGSAIDYKTDGTVPSANATTNAAPSSPDLMITEIMQNPDYVADANGEWFEIYNYGNTTVNINGYVIKDAGSDSHTIDNSGPLNIAAGAFLVLGINSDEAANGGVPVDYQYSGITLGNGDDEIYLYMTDGTTLVDKVEWDGGTNWPDPNSASMVFTGQSTDDNNIGSNWTTSTVRENNYNTTGTDKGSPGTNGKGQDLVSATTWTGTGNWSEGNMAGRSSWSHGSPGNNVSVIVDGDITIDKDASSPATCKDLTINSGKNMTIPMGKAFTVNGDFVNNASAADMVIQSDATGNGSLIVDGTVTGNVTVQRYVGKYTSGTGTGNGWHEIGCPVSSMDPAGTTWDPTRNTTDDLYAWDETTNQWVNYRTTPFTFTAGKGYLVANNNDLTHEYTGTLNTTDITIPGLTSTASAGEGWNLLGNPFSCAIKWDDGNWTLTNVGAVAEIWDETTASYTAINANDIIPSTNGFFVQVTAGKTGSVTIPAAARVHNAQGNYKNAKVNKSVETLTFKVTNDANSYSDKTILGFRPDATQAWDIAFDAHKIMSFVKTSPQIWTVANNGEKFLINYLPETSLSCDVPLDFKPGVNTIYHLTIGGTDSFSNIPLILEDLKTGKKIDLNNVDNYNFSAEVGDDINRFVLHINGVTGVSTLHQDGSIRIFSDGHTVYLHGQEAFNGKVFIFNTLGQKVYEGLLNGTNKQEIRLNEHRGVYFVRLEEKGRVITRKVFIQ